MPRKFKPLLVVAGFICLVILGSVPGHDKSPGAAAAASSGSAEITMLTGAGSDNSCQENDEDARIYVVITLRNDGDAAGTVNPWATFDYSDGGNSTESYGSNHGGQASRFQPTPRSTPTSTTRSIRSSTR